MTTLPEPRLTPLDHFTGICLSCGERVCEGDYIRCSECGDKCCRICAVGKVCEGCDRELEEACEGDRFE